MSSDWSEEFTKLVRQGIGDADAEAAQEPSQATRASAEARAASDSAAAGPDSDQAAAARRASIAATLVRLGFLPAGPATPDNPAVEVTGRLDAGAEAAGYFSFGLATQPSSSGPLTARSATKGRRPAPAAALTAPMVARPARVARGSRSGHKRPSGLA